MTQVQCATGHIDHGKTTLTAANTKGDSRRTALFASVALSIFIALSVVFQRQTALQVELYFQ